MAGDHLIWQPAVHSVELDLVINIDQSSDELGECSSAKKPDLRSAASHVVGQAVMDNVVGPGSMVVVPPASTLPITLHSKSNLTQN